MHEDLAFCVSLLSAIAKVQTRLTVSVYAYIYAIYVYNLHITKTQRMFGFGIFVGCDGRTRKKKKKYKQKQDDSGCNGQTKKLYRRMERKEMETENGAWTGHGRFLQIPGIFHCILFIIFSSSSFFFIAVFACALVCARAFVYLYTIIISTISADIVSHSCCSVPSIFLPRCTLFI